MSQFLCIDLTLVVLRNWYVGATQHDFLQHFLDLQGASCHPLPNLKVFIGIIEYGLIRIGNYRITLTSSNASLYWEFDSWGWQYLSTRVNQASKHPLPGQQPPAVVTKVKHNLHGPQYPINRHPDSPSNHDGQRRVIKITGQRSQRIECQTGCPNGLNIAPTGLEPIHQHTNRLRRFETVSQPWVIPICCD